MRVFRPDDGVTMAMPACDPRCPPHGEWPAVNLIRGECPKCGKGERDGVKAARVLRARALAKLR